LCGTSGIGKHSNQRAIVMNKKRWIVAGAVCAVIALGMAVALLFVPQAMVLGSVHDREVVGHVARRLGPARFESDGKTATVQLGSHTTRVTAEHVELPGGRVLKIPDGCKRVELFATGKDVRVVFDGQEQK
jgi:hypothetical protein